MDIYFNTVNTDKISEIKFLFKPHKKYACHFFKNNIVEILNNNIENVIKQKAISAYDNCRMPVIVEHGALEVEYFNNFPGALSKPMWDLMGDKICKLIPESESRKAKVISAVGYCDGKTIKTFIEGTNGEISAKGMGTNGFQFDPIFIPNGSDKTYAQMKLDEKMKFSQATKSYGKLIEFLETL
jgi:XTP/dITP diphosphohydrolase